MKIDFERLFDQKTPLRIGKEQNRSYLWKSGSYVIKKEKTYALEAVMEKVSSIKRPWEANILPIYDVVLRDPDLFTVMPKVDGTLLEFPEFRERHTFRYQLETAVTTLHKAGIVHTDIFPRNIFIDLSTNRVLLGDFDEARLVPPDCNSCAFEDDWKQLQEVLARSAIIF